MMPLCAIVAVAMLLTPTARTAPAAGLRQDDRAILDSLADETARRISRFADRRVAIAAGYRRIGTDFPSMGEHWLHPGALLAQRIDADRPTILTYAVIDGRPTLLGAGYVITTRGSDTAAVPGWPTYWHEHSGLLSDESGAHLGAAQESDSATHVWVLHLWSALPNPLGRYDSDNWALPFARAGITPPADLDVDVGRALSLTVGAGDAYLQRVLTDAGLRAGDTRAIDSAIEDARLAAVEVVARTGERTGERRTMRADDVQALRDAWGVLAGRLRAAAGPAIEPLLAPPHAHHGDPPAAVRARTCSSGCTPVLPLTRRVTRSS